MRAGHLEGHLGFCPLRSLPPQAPSGTSLSQGLPSASGPFLMACSLAVCHTLSPPPPPPAIELGAPSSRPWMVYNILHSRRHRPHLLGGWECCERSPSSGPDGPGFESQLHQLRDLSQTLRPLPQFPHLRHDFSSIISRGRMRSNRQAHVPPSEGARYRLSGI